MIPLEAFNLLEKRKELQQIRALRSLVQSYGPEIGLSEPAATIQQNTKRINILMCYPALPRAMPRFLSQTIGSIIHFATYGKSSYNGG